MFRLDNDTAYMSVGGECVFSCAYCYTLSPDYKIDSEQTISEIIKEMADLKLDHNVKLVKLGCDSEIFANPAFASTLIEEIAKWGVDISFATKQNLFDSTVEHLTETYEDMKKRNHELVAFVSLIGYATAKKIEKNVPSPEQRIETIVRLHNAGIPTFVYMKPMLPFVPTEEIDYVISQTENHCIGFVIGDMISSSYYLKHLGVADLEKVGIPKWFSNGTKGDFFGYTDERIARYLQRDNFFATSNQAIAFVKEHMPVSLK
ncbi:MAG: radical SAM protein [Candidatus Woesearchaeota archaeon]